MSPSFWSFLAVSLAVSLVIDPQSVSAACECGYSTHAIKDNTNYVYTDVLETDFLHVQDIAAQRDWVRQVWSVPPVGTAHWGRNMTLDNTRTNPLPGDVGTEGVNGGDSGLQLSVRSGTPEGGDIPGAELATARTDMLYGSFRAGMKYTGQSGTCGAFFWYHNDSAEIDFEFLSKLYTDPNHSDLLLVIHADPSVDTSKLFHPWTVPFRPDFGYHEYRFDWTPDSVTYYADGQFLYRFTDGVPAAPGKLFLNHWSNGDPGWSAGPPAQDAHLEFSYIKAYFNTTASDELKCRDPSAPNAICEVPDQTTPPDPSQKTTFLLPNKGIPPIAPVAPDPAPSKPSEPAKPSIEPAKPPSKKVSPDATCGGTNGLELDNMDEEKLDCEIALLDHDDDFPHHAQQPKKYTTARTAEKLLRIFSLRLLTVFTRWSSSFIHDEWYFKRAELMPAWYNHSSSLPPPKPHPTSYLDGLRGVAALCVFFHHSTQLWLPGLRPGWGSTLSSNHLLQLPLVRIFYSGGAMVSIFFVISGYVLSYKPLALARQGRYEELLVNLTSSTFRRGPRLFVPCIVSTFLTAVLAMTGAFVDEGVARHYPRAETWAGQMGAWMNDTLWFINPFAVVSQFEPNTWTIPTEYQGSLIVFLCALGLSRCRNGLRVGILVCFVGYWLWFGYWATVLFLSGMVMADVRHGHRAPDAMEINGKVRSLRNKLGHGLLVLVAVFLLSMPEYDEAVTESYGYATLATTLTPHSWSNHFGPGRWWPCLSAILLVATIDSAGPDSVFQQLFTYRFPQYLGRISFSFYLCHGAVLYTVGLRTQRFFSGVLGDETIVVYCWSLLLGACITVPFLFWISDVFTVVVDRGAVTLSRSMMKL
ncbi:MAG: hypothetical protein Q9220_002204 [cf. Caloplaca sp. 1 TL-2023]